jgi:diacylglycerol kinase family enzyme
VLGVREHNREICRREWAAGGSSVVAAGGDGLGHLL